jgi:hypothetical protein
MGSRKAMKHGNNMVRGFLGTMNLILLQMDRVLM